MADWIVRWRAVDPAGAPDKWCAVTVSGKVANSAIEAIYVIQTQREYDLWERCPGRAFVDWEAVTAGTPSEEPAPAANEWRRLCVLLLLQHGRTINVDEVTLTRADDLNSYTVAWSRNPTSFSWQVRAFRDPDSFDKAPDRPLGGPDVSSIAAARAAVLERLEPIYRQRLLEDNSLDAVLEQFFPGCTQPSGPHGRLRESLDGTADVVGPNPYEED